MRRRSFQNFLLRVTICFVLMPFQELSPRQEWQMVKNSLRCLNARSKHKKAHHLDNTQTNWFNRIGHDVSGGVHIIFALFV